MIELAVLAVTFVVVLGLIGWGTWIVMGDVSHTWREGTRAKREAAEAKARNVEVIRRVREFEQRRRDLDDLFEEWDRGL
jgi:hypothetical protein